MPVIRVAGLLLLLLVFGKPSIAQEAAPTVEVFGGYSLLPANGDDFPRQTSHGFQAGVSANLNRWFGVFGDFGMHFNTATDLGPAFAGRVAKSSVREYLFGPRFTARSQAANFFIHGLVGLADGDAGEGFEEFSDRKLAFGAGVGVDIGVHRRLAIRTQFDALASFADIVEGNSRFAVGLVVRTGGL
jgi:opacity protein-like surface antigen